MVVVLVLPYNTAKKFFDVINDHKNEDGYAVCSLTYAVQATGIATATAILLLDRFAEMGCIQLYVKRYKRDEREGPNYKKEGKVIYRLVKILRPLTRADYVDYWWGPEQVVVIRRLRKH